MEANVSIPDPIFEAGESLAERLGCSRSELYARALQAFIATHDRQNITDALNRVYDKYPSSLDATVTQMQFGSLPREDFSGR